MRIFFYLASTLWLGHYDQNIFSFHSDPHTNFFPHQHTILG